MTKHIYCDMVIVGCGAAGLYTTLNLPKDLHVLMVCKEDMDTCDSMLARGGIYMLRGKDDYESYFEGIMKVGRYENRRESMDLMIRTSPGATRHFLKLGVGFDENLGGSLKYTKEGAYSRPRICFHEDITDRAITAVLQEQTTELPNVDIVEHTVMMNTLATNRVYVGILARTEDDSTLSIRTRDTVMATGGIGGLHQHPTNFPYLAGDVLTIARRHGVELEHPDYVQVHPANLYAERLGGSFFISESARGRGAVLPNNRGECFINKLLPRDTVSQAIGTEMEREGSGRAWLSFTPMPRKITREHFSYIYEACPEEGYGITEEPTPMVPTQYYFANGMRADLDLRTIMEHLYAVGETSCSGIHGKNRLVNNNLLEGLMFAEKAAKRIENSQKGRINYESSYHAACC